MSTQQWYFPGPGKLKSPVLFGPRAGIVQSTTNQEPTLSLEQPIRALLLELFRAKHGSLKRYHDGIKLSLVQNREHKVDKKKFVDCF